MKNRLNRILLVIFWVGLLVYAAIFYAFIQYGGIFYDFPAAYRFFQFCRYLLLVGLAVPFFALQLLLCRRSEGKSKFPAILLLAALLLLLGFFAAAACIVPGWDALGWAFLAVDTAAPAVGCVLAWMVWGISRLCRKKAPRA